MAVRFRRRNVVYLFMLAGLLAVTWASYRSFTPAQKPLSELLTALDGKQVVRGTFNSDQARIDWADVHAREYRAFYATGYEATPVDKFHENQLPFDAEQPAKSDLWLTVILPNAILFVVIAGFIYYVLRRNRGTPPRPIC